MLNLTGPRRWGRILVAGTILTAGAAPAAAQNDKYPRDYFRSPLDIELSLSGNFGEIRPNHFHAGLDFRTQGKEGLNVYAAADGYVSRIKVSPYGYGRALYITHPNGYVTVYGHLSGYAGAIGEFIKKAQYEKESFEIELFPAKDELKVTKGQVVAYSGNTGGSGGPHLHFEIRDEKTEHIINPLYFGFSIPDAVSPKIKSIAIYPLAENSMVNGKKTAKFIPVTNTKGKHSIKAPELPVVSGPVGFAIEAVDGENNSPGPNGPYTIELYVDGQKVYSHLFETFSFDQSRYVNAHIDYPAKRSSGKALQRSFLLRNNQLGIYRDVKDSGRINFNDSALHKVKYVVSDIKGNSSVLEFTVKGKPAEPAAPPTFGIPAAGEFTYWQDNHYQTDDIRIDIPKNALYENIIFRHTKSRDTLAGAIAPTHTIHDNDVPLHLPCTIAIKTKLLVNSLQSKALIVSVNGKKISAEGGEWLDGWITMQTKSFGRYTVVLDTIAPVIKPVKPEAFKNMSAAKTIAFKVSDNLSGIRSYRATVDGKWILLEYEPKQALLFYVFDENVEKGSHKLKLEVTDGRGNIASEEYSFKR